MASWALASISPALRRITPALGAAATGVADAATFFTVFFLVTGPSL